MMQLTERNAGDILQLNTGKRLQIDSVTAQMVRYTEESGERYCTPERNIDARKVTDPKAISVFRTNMELGQTLNAAESAALRRLLSGHFPEAERKDAERVLSTVTAQKKLLAERLAQQRGIAMGSPLAQRVLEAAQQHGNVPAGPQPDKPHRGR